MFCIHAGAHLILCLLFFCENLFAFKLLFRKGFGKIKKKRKKKEKGENHPGNQAEAQLFFPPRPSFPQLVFRPSSPGNARLPSLPFLRPTAGALSFSRWRADPTAQRHLLPLPSLSQTPRWQSILGSLRFPSLSAQPSPYKIPSPAPHASFRSKCVGKAPATLASRSASRRAPLVRPTLFQAPSGRDRRTGEFARSSASFPCPQFVDWCSKSSRPRTPASLASPTMVPPRRKPTPAAGSVAWLPLRRSEPFDRHPTVPNRRYPFGVKIVKEPSRSLRINPRSYCAFPECVFYFWKRKQHGLKLNTFSVIYRNAIKIVLVIKCSF